MVTSNSRSIEFVALTLYTTVPAASVAATRTVICGESGNHWMWWIFANGANFLRLAVEFSGYYILTKATESSDGTRTQNNFIFVIPESKENGCAVTKVRSTRAVTSDERDRVYSRETRLQPVVICIRS